jgi:hypothetical protein
MNSEFLQLAVIEMPERFPSLPIFAPSPKPKHDDAKDGARTPGPCEVREHRPTTESHP